MRSPPAFLDEAFLEVEPPFVNGLRRAEFFNAFETVGLRDNQYESRVRRPRDLAPDVLASALEKIEHHSSYTTTRLIHGGLEGRE